MFDHSSASSRLRIFVSSTIRECADERSVVKRALSSTDHLAFIFEEVGARPYPPPELFLPELDRSHIFVGIYKDSYGWIAPGAVQSGLEQEFERARFLGIPRLLYVFRRDDTREVKLRRMLESVQGEVTLFTIDEAEDLFRRLKDDIENTIAEKFERVEAVDTSITLSHTTLQASTNDLDLELRPDLLATLESLQRQGAIVVTGQRGSGKSRLLLTLAKRHQGIYVAAKGLDRHLLCSVIVNTFRRRAGLTPEYFLTPEASGAAALALWNGEDNELRLFVDDCSDESLLRQLLHQGRAVDERHWLVASAAHAPASLSMECVDLPPVSVEHALLYLRTCHDQGTIDEEIKRAPDFGNPLFLELWCKHPKHRKLQSVEAIDLALFRELSAECRELVSCVALGLETLQLPELSLATARAIPDILDLADQACHFLAQSQVGLQFHHSHQRDGVIATLESEVLRRTYLQRRIARALNKRRAPLRAFTLLDSLGDPQALKFAPGAMFEATQRNDLGALLRVTQKRLEHNVEAAPAELAYIWLARGFAERQGGLDTDAWQSFTEAGLAAAQSEDAGLIRDVKFVVVSESAAKHLDSASLQTVVDMVESVSPEDEAATRARYAVDLSALYLRMDEVHAAATRAREALDLFTKVKDPYGVAVAQKNLVSAVSQSTTMRRAAEETGELQQLLASLENYRVETGSIRDRAWFCNLQTLRSRTAGQLKEAFSYAKEAIAIAEQLGDLRLKGINQINLGNVLRDLKDFPEAVKQYLEASAVGFKVGDPHLESSASRLASTVYVEQGLFEPAVDCARYAAERVAGTTATEAYLEALEQQAFVEKQLRRPEDAAESYYKAFVGASGAPSQASQFLLYYLQQMSKAKRYAEGVGRITAQPITDQEARDQYVYARWALGTYRSLIEEARDENLVDITELHLERVYSRLDNRSAEVFLGNLLNVAASLRSDRQAALALLALFATMPSSRVTRKALTEAEERVGKAIPELSYRAERDGTSRWAVTLGRHQPILVVIYNLDPKPSTSLIATAIVLFMWAFEVPIRQDLLAGVEPLKHEVEFRVAHRESLPEDLAGLIPVNESHVSVTEQREYRIEDSIPALIVYEEDLMSEFARVEGKTPGLLTLLGFVLSAFTKTVLLGQLDSHETSPKIAQLLRQAFL